MWPLTVMATRSTTPLLTMLRIDVRRKSCRILSGDLNLAGLLGDDFDRGKPGLEARRRPRLAVVAASFTSALACQAREQVKATLMDRSLPVSHNRALASLLAVNHALAIRTEVGMVDLVLMFQGHVNVRVGVVFWRRFFLVMPVCPPRVCRRRGCTRYRTSWLRP